MAFFMSLPVSQYRPIARGFPVDMLRYLRGQTFPFVSPFSARMPRNRAPNTTALQPDEAAEEEEGGSAGGAGQGEGVGAKAGTRPTAATRSGKPSSPPRSRSPRSGGGGGGSEVGDVLHKGPMLGELPALGRPPGKLKKMSPPSYIGKTKQKMYHICCVVCVFFPGMCNSVVMTLIEDSDVMHTERSQVDPTSVSLAGEMRVRLHDRFCLVLPGYSTLDPTRQPVFPPPTINKVK